MWQPLRRNRKDAQNGAVLIEFAIVVPLLLLLALGIYEFSYAFYHLDILNKSVQNGARYFSNPLYGRAVNATSNLQWPINTTGTNPNVAKARNLIIYGTTSASPPPLLPGVANYSVPDPLVVGANNDHIRVTATYRYNLISGTAVSAFMKFVNGGSGPTFNSIPLSASTVIRVEGG